MRLIRVSLLFLLAMMALSSCKVGPDFHSPTPPEIPRYTETPLPKQTVGPKKQQFLMDADLPADWWRLFHSRALNHLIVLGLAHSPNLQAAIAALCQAQELLRSQIGLSYYPQVTSNFSGQRQEFSQATIGGPPETTIFNLFTASVSVSYTFDVFGGERRLVESLAAQVDYQRYQLMAAYLTLTSNIVTTAISIASLEDQIHATQQLIHAEGAQLRIMQAQFKLGGISKINVLTQATLLAQTQATLPTLEKSLSQANHALAVLIGTTPNRHPNYFRLDQLHLPTNLPVSLSSNLVRQRPDVMASEALLHVASAKIGVATANLLPQFTVSGNGGWTSTVLSNLIQAQNKVWLILGSITQPIFEGGALWAQRRASIDAYNQAFAQYRQVVLQALQNVSDTLKALEMDAKTFQAQRLAKNSAKRELVLTTAQYRLGGVNYLVLLTAEQQYHQAYLSYIQAKALRYSDTAALYQALGGGWWNYWRKA